MSPQSMSLSPYPQPIPENNEVLLTRDMLVTILNDFSGRVLAAFGRQIRLVVHGGAVMLLHPGLYGQPGSKRQDTRDVDYIHRAFVDEWRQMGVMDAGDRLQSCIDATARAFTLGRDWFNAHADVALPMATDQSGRQYDPIVTASLKPNNIHLHTVFVSPGLTLISVTPFWAVALKLVRYQKHDPTDITAILRNGTRLNGVKWNEGILEQWIKTECWAMGYANYPENVRRDMSQRIAHAVAQLNEDPIGMTRTLSDSPPPSDTNHRPHSMSFTSPPPPQQHPSQPPLQRHHSLESSNQPRSMSFPDSTHQMPMSLFQPQQSNSLSPMPRPSSGMFSAPVSRRGSTAISSTAYYNQTQAQQMHQQQQQQRFPPSSSTPISMPIPSSMPMPQPTPQPFQQHQPSDISCLQSPAQPLHPHQELNILRSSLLLGATPSHTPIPSHHRQQQHLQPPPSHGHAMGGMMSINMDGPVIPTGVPSMFVPSPPPSNSGFKALAQPPSHGAGVSPWAMMAMSAASQHQQHQHSLHGPSWSVGPVRISA